MSEILETLAELVQCGCDSCAAREGEVAAEITRLCAENDRLRDALVLCRMELFKAAYYRGYEGGPLERPSVGLALREADAALKGDSDE